MAPLGESKVNDRPALGVKVSRKGGKEVNLYFDKETGLLGKIESRTKDAMTGQEVNEERIVLAYQDVDQGSSWRWATRTRREPSSRGSRP